MKKRIKNLFSLICFLTISIIGTLGAASATPLEETQESAVVESQKAEKVEKKQLSAEITYGFDKWAKYGRYMSVNVEITNHEENFDGMLQIILPQNYRENILYQKDVILAKGETKTISICIPMPGAMNTRGGNRGQINLKIVDKNEKKIFEKKLNINIPYGNDLIYIGALTDDFNSLNYFAISKKTKLFSLTEKNLPDNYLGLDPLDIIIINNYNTDKLSKEQYNAIQMWVSNGGTLVIGTGANANKTLQLFQKDNFLVGKQGKVSKETISLDIEKVQEITDGVLIEEAGIEAEENTIIEGQETNLFEVTKDILEIDLEGAKAILNQQDSVLLQYLQHISGNIQLFSFDIGLEYEYWDTIGKQIYTVISSNLSKTKKAQLENERDQINRFYNITENISIRGKEQVPKVGKYILIFLIYLILIGPILYFILKKKDKREWTWIIIPIFSIVFACIIYGIGSSTRITKPFLNYIGLLKLEQHGKASDEIYFSLTAPFNMKYSIETDPKYNIEVLENSNFYRDAESDFESYQTAFKYKPDKTIIEIKDKAAFTPVNFVSKSKTEVEGSWESNLKYNNYKFSGTFSNHLGTDIENAAIIGNGELINIGNIKSEETVEIQDKESISFLVPEDLYNNREAIIKDIVGGYMYDSDASIEIRRKSAALSYYIENFGFDNIINASYLIGFIDRKEEELMDEIGLDSNGIYLVVIPLSIDYTDQNITTMPFIDPYLINTNTFYNSKYRYINEDTLRLEYQFPKEDKILSIIYPSQLNKEFQNNQNLIIYSGTISAYNYKTGNYDKWFESGKEEEITDLENYIDKNNKLLLLYEVDKTALNDKLVSLPVLSVRKETR